jgi:hypothetical protein
MQTPIHSNLHARGKQSGKQANPDMLSAAAKVHVHAHVPPFTAGAGAPTAVPAHNSNSQPTLIVTSRLHNIFTLLCHIAYLMIYDLLKITHQDIVYGL